MEANIPLIFKNLFSFLIICLSSNQMGKIFARFKLPTITGYLFLGTLIGPDILNFIDRESIRNLHFIDEIALSFIALSAGSELFWKDIRPQLKPIFHITWSILFFSFIICSYAFYLLSGEISFMDGFNTQGKIAVSILTASILIARSPSVVIAMVKELKSKGLFTQIALGVTILGDIAVICIFSISMSFAKLLLTNEPINFSVLLVLMTEIGLSVILGFILSYALRLLINFNLPHFLKLPTVILMGYSTFLCSKFILTNYDLHIEAMISCLVAGFDIANFYINRKDFIRTLNQSSSIIYIAFFTLTGASLTLSILEKVWFITIILLLVRIIGIIVGSYIGGKISNSDPQHTKIRWMSFITQAGVALGLAKQVSDMFPTWGPEFATILISVVIINEIVGPGFLKLSLILAGEAKQRAKKSEKHTIPNAIIFGENNDALALSRQLCAHNWEVRLIKFGPLQNNFEDQNFKFIETELGAPNKKLLEDLKAHDDDTFICMLNDEDNLSSTKLINACYPDAHVIVSLRSRENIKNFNDLNTSIVDPTTALISLLDHYVRTPSAVSILLGYEADQDIIDCKMDNYYFQGKTLFELNLPEDVLILSVTRKGKNIEFHGGFRLELNDHLTLIGNIDSLENIKYKLSSPY